MKPDSERKQKPSRKRRLARFIAKLALAAIIIIWGVQEVWAEDHWVTALVTYAPPILYLAIPLAALALSVVCWDGQAVAWSLAAGVLCLVGIAQPSLAWRAAKPVSGKTIRVVTWNVHGQIESIPAIRDGLRELDPDIVCLQEAHHGRFARCWPEANVARHRSLMILTSGDLKHAEPVELEAGEPEFRTPVEAEIRLPEGTVSVLDVHLYSYQLTEALRHPSRERARQFTEKAVGMRSRQIPIVTRWLDEQTGPAIVTGDFNTPPRGRLYGELADVAIDSFRASGKGFGWSFPAGRPVLRIDYIWAAGGARPVSCRTVETGPSDHVPVVAELVLP